jgi:tricorn protease-like protein
MNGNTQLLLKHQKTFREERSKFAEGYYAPDISSDGKRVLFIDAEYKNIIKDKNKGKQKTFIFELDLTNMSKKLLFSSPTYLYRPRYSPDCQEVLFEVLSKNCKSDFYIYDIANSITTKIGEWDSAQWIY